MVVEPHIVSVEHVDLLSDGADVVALLQDAARKQISVLFCISELFLQTQDQSHSIAE